MLRDGPDLPMPPPAPPRTRWWTVAVAIVLVAGVVGVLAPQDAAGEAVLLGRLDDSTGRSSSFPPVSELRPLWRRQADRLRVAAPPPVIVALGDRVAIGTEVLDPASGQVVATVPVTLGRTGPDGRALVVAGDQVVTVDPGTGEVLQRSSLAPAGGWSPRGPVLGWVAGAAVVSDGERLGAITTDGRVRWVLGPEATWGGVGDGTDWLVATVEGPTTRVVVYDGVTGAVVRDVGPASVIATPVVVDDVLVYVDPGRPPVVSVVGIRLDGSGRAWRSAELPPTSDGAEIRLTAAGAQVAVHYDSPGRATTSVWLRARDGQREGLVAVGGDGRSGEGWPLAVVVGDLLVHVDPVRDEVRAVDVTGTIRWVLPGTTGEGVVGGAGIVVLRTPPRGTSLQARERVLEATTGMVVLDRIVDGPEHLRLVAGVDGHVVAAPSATTAIDDQRWLTLDSGRFRDGVGVLARHLQDVDGSASLVGLTGRSPATAVFARADADRDAATTWAAAAVTYADEDLSVEVTPTSVTASGPNGDERWRVASDVVLQPDRAVLLADRLVVLDVTGVVRTITRTDGALGWSTALAATAITAGGERLIVGARDGRVLVLDADGRVAQEVWGGSDPVEDVAVLDGVVVASVGADVVAFGRGAVVVEPDDRVEVP